jgi:transposase-like protein
MSTESTKAGSQTRLTDQQIAEQLVEQAKTDGVDLVGPGGLLSDLTKTVLETALEVEMSEHLGYDKHAVEGRNNGNSRNGTRSKTVLTEAGPVTIEVPRDREGTFDPKTVKKHSRRMPGVDELVISLSAKGLTTGEISALFAEVWGADVSKDTISKITDKVLAEMTEWQNRPLDTVYPVVFIDAMVVKIRDGLVANRPIYCAIGVTVDGERDILGLWVGTGGEGAKYWLQVLTEIKNRGTKDVCIVVSDGLTGMTESIAATWPQATHQTCVLHLIRNTFRYASKADWSAIANDLRPVYRAPTEAAARARFEEFTDKWNSKYPAIVKLWESAWAENAAVPAVRSRDPRRHLLHERDRVDPRQVPAGRPSTWALPDRERRPEVRLPHGAQPGPHRQRQTQVDEPMEAAPERLRRHLRRPYPQPE